MVKAAVKQKKISASASPRPERTAEEELPVDTREPSSESDLEEEEEEDDESMGVEKPMVQNGAGIGKGKISMEQLRKMREGRQKKGAMAKRLGLSIPPRLIQKTMMKAKYAERVPMKAAIYMTSALELLVEDVLITAMDRAKDQRKGSVSARHIMEAVRSDEELTAVFGNVTISHAGYNSLCKPPPQVDRPTKAEKQKTTINQVHEEEEEEEEEDEAGGDDPTQEV